MGIWGFYIKILLSGLSWQMGRSGHSGPAFPVGGWTEERERSGRGNEPPSGCFHSHHWLALSVLNSGTPVHKSGLYFSLSHIA